MTGSRQKLLFGSGRARYLGEGELSDLVERLERDGLTENEWAHGVRTRPTAMLAFQARNGNYVMIRVIDRSQQQIKLRWAYQPDGTLRGFEMTKWPTDARPTERIATINDQLYKIAHTAVDPRNRQDFEEKVRELTKAGADVNALTSRDGAGPLHAAATYGSPVTIVVLVSAGADVNLRSRSGATPLHSAVAIGRIDNCRSLLQLGADPAIAMNDGVTVLQLAVRAQRTDPEIIELVRRHVDRELSLLDAAEIGDLISVKSALEKSDDINQTDGRGRTAIFLAAQNGHTKICEILLDRGADPHVRGTTPYLRTPTTPLTIAIANQHFAGAKVLVQHDTNYTTTELAEALDEAVNRADTDSARILLTSSVSEDAITKAFKTVLLSGSQAMVDVFLQHGHELPLWAACRLNRIGEVRELINERADVNNSSSGTLPIHYAIQNRSKEAVALLIENGADVNAPAKGLSGLRPLHVAAAADTAEIIELLIAQGADVDGMTPRRFQTPLYYAVMTNQLAAAEALLKNGANPNPVELVESPKDKERVKSYVTMAKDRPAMLALLKKYGARE